MIHVGGTLYAPKEAKSLRGKVTHEHNVCGHPP